MGGSKTKSPRRFWTAKVQKRSVVYGQFKLSALPGIKLVFMWMF